MTWIQDHWKAQEDERRRKGERAHQRWRQRWDKIAALKTLAQSLLTQHGLDGWTIGDLKDLRTDTNRGGDCAAHGLCIESRIVNGEEWGKTIYLALERASRWSLAKQRDLILHEIAHALCTTHHGHDDVWATKAEEIGERPIQVLVDLNTAEYRDGRTKDGRAAKAARLKRVPHLTDAQRIRLIRRLIRGDGA
jgi:hypothetical protein